jgi:hypothetical protein
VKEGMVVVVVVVVVAGELFESSGLWESRADLTLR